MRPSSIPTLGACLVAATVLATAASAKPARFAGVPSVVTPGIQKTGARMAGTTPQAPLLPRSAGQVTSFAFDPVNRELVYAGTSHRTGRIYRSADGGAHWQLSASFPAAVTALAADPQRSGTLYAATGVAAWTWPNNVPTFQGWKHVAVYMTANGGRSWQRRGFLSSSTRLAPVESGLGQGWVTALAVDPTDGNIVYAGTGQGVRKSTDGGHSWHTLLAGRNFFGIWGLATTPTRPRAIYAAALVDASGRCGLPRSGAPTISRCEQTTLFYSSVDGGKTWRGKALHQVELDGPVALDAQSPATLFAAAGFGVYRNGPASEQGIFETTDSGHVWTRLSATCPITALAVDPARTSTLYAGVYRGHGPYYRIVKSIDAGRTWTVTG